MLFRALFVLTAAVTAVWTDLSKGKVPNRWICALWAAGFVCQTADGGIAGAGRFLLGALLPIGVLFPLFRFRMLGPGDIKLLSALGGVMGPAAAGKCVLISIFFGGILSLGILLLRGILMTRLRYFTEYIRKTKNDKRISPYYVTGARPENLHFTVPILMGAILYAGGLY